MSDQIAKIGVDDLYAAAAAGVLRGLRAREVSAERLVASGFAVRIDLTAGRWLNQLNPQPLPPGEVSGSGV